MKFIYLLVIAAFLISNSCSVDKKLAQANMAFANKEYYLAAQKYIEINKKNKDKVLKPQLYHNLAEIYRQTGSYDKAAIWYKNAIRSGYKDSLIEIRYADALRSSGKPEIAKPIYQTIANQNPANTRALNGMKSIELIDQWKEVPPLYLIENLKPINSGTDDFVNQFITSPNRSLLLRSARNEIPDKRINQATGNKFAGFFTTVFDSAKKQWSTPLLLRNPELLNSPDEDLFLKFSKNSGFLVFARRTREQSGRYHEKLFYMKLSGGKWTEPEIISFANDDADYSYPMISADEKTLWFSSNRSNGFGEYDIWKSTISDNITFSEPENAGREINSPGNEIAPFTKPNGQFYFSSDFHPGLGGYDIFKAEKINGKWQIESMPPPVNSGGDDWCIQFEGDKENGYFSSKRKGSKSTDIYSFLLPPKLFQCFGKVYDSESDSILPDANVRIVGSDGSSQTIHAVNGQFQANLNPNNDYTVVIFASGYLNAQAKLSTRGLVIPQEFELNIKSIPTNKPIKIENINYQPAKWELVPEAKASLDKLVELLKLNPEATIEIASHTDDVGDENFNLDLSLKRANSVRQYLINSGIPATKLQTKGYGESMPLKINYGLEKKYPFLKNGYILNHSTIESLQVEKYMETARSLNRRTEFKVLQTQAIQ